MKINSKKIKEIGRIALSILVLPVILPLFAIMLVKKARSDNKPFMIKK